MIGKILSFVAFIIFQSVAMGHAEAQERYQIIRGDMGADQQGPIISVGANAIIGDAKEGTVQFCLITFEVVVSSGTSKNEFGRCNKHVYKNIQPQAGSYTFRNVFPNVMPNSILIRFEKSYISLDSQNRKFTGCYLLGITEAPFEAYFCATANLE